MLKIENINYLIAGRPIFETATASVMDGWKVGIVGANGAGKSTLFKLISGELQADGGEITLSNKYNMGMVRQDMPDDDTSLIDIVLAADKERTKLLADSETETDPYKIADIHTRLNDIDAYAAPARASTILAGLGFKEEQITHPISSFSGGWRMRVALAGVLFQQPDFLLLDEPTNHLDLEAIMWLETYLMNYPKTLMIISHDREILNKCIDHVIHVENKKLTTYTGTYDTFEKERAERLMSQQKLHEKQQAQMAHMQAYVDRFRYKASKAKQAQSRLKALEKMDVVDAVMADRSIKFNFPQPEELAPPVLSIDDVNVGYEENNPVLSNLKLRIDMDDRIALLGANGNGKSTLIKLIASRLEPMQGETHQSNKLRIGYFSQHQTEELDFNSTPFEEMSQIMKGQGESKIRANLGKFGFNKDLADNKIKDLSGGEKSRLLFAIMSHNAPHLLLLDEPTNHLDMDAREALVRALNNYNGAVVIVSHDPSMVERVADTLWLVEKGECKTFDGDLKAYRQHVLDAQRQGRKKDKANKNGSNNKKKSGPSKKERQKISAAKRQQFPELFEKLDTAEKNLASLIKQRKNLESQMATSAFYDDEDKAQETQFSYGLILKDIEEKESIWLAAQEIYDSSS